MGRERASAPGRGPADNADPSYRQRPVLGSRSGIDGQDVEAFFIAWQVGDSAADVNRDGGVDGGDVEAFFVRWQRGEC